MRIIEELEGRDGPTGTFVAVKKAIIVDVGGNVYATVTTPDEAYEFLHSRQGGPYYLRAVSCGEDVQPNLGDDDSDLRTGILGFGLA